ncbi:MAG: hypothetical protein IMZ47_01985, partial [Firmicutes bacterium]|nr:hypothetical protein [Bacillota bacterium]
LNEQKECDTCGKGSSELNDGGDCQTCELAKQVLDGQLTQKEAGLSDADMMHAENAQGSKDEACRSRATDESILDQTIEEFRKVEADPNKNVDDNILQFTPAQSVTPFESVLESCQQINEEGNEEEPKPPSAGPENDPEPEDTVEEEAEVEEGVAAHSDTEIFISKSSLGDGWDVQKVRPGGKSSTVMFTFDTSTEAEEAGQKIADAIGGTFHGDEDPRYKEEMPEDEEDVEDLDQAARDRAIANFDATHEDVGEAKVEEAESTWKIGDKVVPTDDACMSCRFKGTGTITTIEKMPTVTGGFEVWVKDEAGEETKTHNNQIKAAEVDEEAVADMHVVAEDEEVSEATGFDSIIDGIVNHINQNFETDRGPISLDAVTDAIAAMDNDVLTAILAGLKERGITVEDDED